jgi:hypothetical protein
MSHFATHAQQLEKIVEGTRKPYRDVRDFGGGRRASVSIAPRSRVPVTEDMEDDFILLAQREKQPWGASTEIVKRHNHILYRAFRQICRLFRGPLVNEPPALFGDLAHPYGGRTSEDEMLNVGQW